MSAIRWYNPTRSRSGMLAQYRSHPGAIRAAILATVEIWSRQERLETPPFKWLHGKQEGLFEIEANVGKRPFRILGYCGPGRDYTLLTAFEKAHGVMSYGRPSEQAFRRIRYVERDGTKAPTLPI